MGGQRVYEWYILRAAGAASQAGVFGAAACSPAQQLYRIPQPAATGTRHEVGTTTTAGSTAPPRSIRAVNNSVTRIVNHPHCLNKLYKILSHTCGSVKKPNAATPKLYQPNVTTPKLYRPTWMDGPKQEPAVEVLSSLLACAKKGARAATLC